MPAAIIVLIAVAAGLSGMLYVLSRAQGIPDRAIGSTDSILAAVAAQGGLPPSDSWLLEPSHRKPLDPYTLEQAHAVMQHHRECGTDICRAKHAAFWTLVDAGKLVTDGRVTR